MWKNLSKEILQPLKFEPKKAIYADKAGLAKYEEFFNQAKILKNKPKFILIEIDPSQITNIKKIIKSLLSESKIKIKKDLAGLDRVLIVTVNG